jgi:hypothetical protein
MPLHLPDPDIQTGPWEKVKDGVQRNLDALAQAVIDSGEQSAGIRAGQVALTWAAALNSGVATVTHGLGRVPVAVTATVKDPSGGTGQIPQPSPFNFTTTTFQIYAEVRVAFTGTQTITWIAYG